MMNDNLRLPNLWIFSFSLAFILFCIQVEHVVREEKTMAAYELVEIYCELIAARLSMIESQKYLKLVKIIFSTFYLVYTQFMSLLFPNVFTNVFLYILEGVSFFLFVDWSFWKFIFIQLFCNLGNTTEFAFVTICLALSRKCVITLGESNSIYTVKSKR